MSVPVTTRPASATDRRSGIGLLLDRPGPWTDDALARRYPDGKSHYLDEFDIGHPQTRPLRVPAAADQTGDPVTLGRGVLAGRPTRGAHDPPAVPTGPVDDHPALSAPTLAWRPTEPVPRAWSVAARRREVVVQWMACRPVAALIATPASCESPIGDNSAFTSGSLYHRAPASSDGTST